MVTPTGVPLVLRVLLCFGALWGSWSRSAQRVKGRCVWLVRGGLSCGPARLGSDSRLSGDATPMGRVRKTVGGGCRPA